MCLFSHKWQEQQRYFVPPIDWGDFRGSNPKTLFKLTGGFTVIVLKCMKCGDVQSREVMGDAMPPKLY